VTLRSKRGEKRTVTFLTPNEVQALLDAPERTTWAGRRDHALLLTAVQTGLRVSEVLWLTRADTHAMTLLGAGIDTSTIALWLGHEQERTTHVYLHADLALKQRTLDRITPPSGHPGRYRAPDSITDFLDNL
jgi:integrase/recombinase XerD